jgi:hypothetical protein
MRSLSQAELREKRLQAATRLAVQVFSRLSDGTPVPDTRVVAKPPRMALSALQRILLRFKVRPFAEGWGTTGVLPRPITGECEACPAAVRWPEDAHNSTLAEIRRKIGGRLVCCHDPIFLGSGKRKHRPRVVTSRVRARCPLDPGPTQ